jgi:hypothetical protein
MGEEVKAFGTNVVLHQVDIDIVTEFAQKLGVSFSAALRMIVRDWDRRTNPQPAEAQPVEATR